MFIINSQALCHLFKTSLVALGFVSLNACQSMVGIANMSALKQAQTFWPTSALQGKNLQVAVLPARSTEKNPAAGGTLGVQLQLTAAARTESAYRLQANQPGQAAATLANVMALRLFLVDANLGIPTGSVAPFPGTGDIFTVNTVTSNQNILFTQVPTGLYYVCVAAFSISAGPFLPSSNITALGSTSYGEGSVQCSNSGGNGDGSIGVGAAPTYAVSNTAPLGVSLNLKSATGASVELSATVTDG